MSTTVKLLLWLMTLLGGVAHANTVTYIYTDPQGTPLAEANASGAITATYDYAPYGSQAMGAAHDGPGYNGHVSDADTGLVYMQARYYDPGTGRFLNVDPVEPTAGNIFSFNRYHYAGNNPINHIDPDGRCPDGMCGEMLKAHVEWRMSHPNAPADGLEKAAFVGVGVMLTASGLGAVVEVAEGSALLNKVLSDSAEPSSGKTFTTYTREKSDGTVYSGRTSGKADPEKQVANRISRGRDHQAKTAEGYGAAKVDKNSSNPDAIRGREQQLIEQNGGARSQGGTSGNAINGVSPTNTKGPGYRAACAKEFGC